MNKRLSFFVVILASCILNFSASDAHARGKKRRTLPGGIVFPNLNQAANTNPATLKQQKGSSLQVLYAPPLDSTLTAHNYTVSVASVSKSFGFGAGYTGSYDPNAATTLTHGAFVGGGFSTGDLGLGVALRETNLDDTTSAALDLGFSYEANKSLTVSGIVQDVTRDTRVAVVGLGFQKKGAYNIELNITSPTFDNLGSTAYQGTLIGGVYTGIFGAAWSTTYALDTDTFSNQLTGLIRPMSNLDIFVTIDLGTVRTYNFGITLAF